ncbi:40S ribosomal S10-like protein [Medicago truncatula]|uniref:40S ribosomal S10-like protein n=1 Tax=Medicago truncatula TaxID=3880 RepID=G7L026_MEDTR|nr:40S ribosomal S10-like protein [Medicago truncatula]
MIDMFNVQAQFNGGEPRRMKIRYLGVTLRGLKDQLDEFNQGVNPVDTRRVE